MRTTLLAAAEGAADFSQETWWLVVGKALAVFVFLVVTTLVLIWFERRVIGRMQQRPGPNRTGPFGYTVRVVPRHVGLATPSELGLVAWA